jgi:hypothetical protein
VFGRERQLPRLRRVCWALAKRGLLERRYCLLPLSVVALEQAPFVREAPFARYPERDGIAVPSDWYW